MSLRKKAPIDKPYATFMSGEFEYRVLRVNQPKKKLDRYTTWFVAGRSPATFGSWEYGDMYSHQVLAYVTNKVFTPEFKAYLEAA